MDFISSLPSGAVAKAMNDHGIVPDVLKDAPDNLIQVSYPNDVVVKLGNELTPTQVKERPSVLWEANANSFYTLCMTDPDAPSRAEPTFREWHHWLVGNIPGKQVPLGDVLSDYIGSGPPEGTGLHRYVFLVFQQNGKIAFDEPRLPNNSGDKRGCFSIAKFAEKYKLELIAGNFYQAQYDDYVPILYKQLGE
ncbi:protein D3-like isoform X2 [Sitophilus oryzae]|uniref:Protein D3-like isoform X2 n=1 Tax=Sitophilus oryzae TaxID=7048 RepID=A0A6J2XAT2_SITOR|nr:protein D3-like isoform X2 [Sitophilus oryzae]